MVNARPAGEASVKPWIWALVALGLALRLYHYGRNPAVWHDEAANIINVIQKNFGELLGPLSYSATGPPVFLWMQRAVVLALGDGTYALRLVSLLASCASLLLFARLARPTLRESRRNQRGPSRRLLGSSSLACRGSASLFVRLPRLNRSAHAPERDPRVAFAPPRVPFRSTRAASYLRFLSRSFPLRRSIHGIAAGAFSRAALGRDGHPWNGDHTLLHRFRFHHDPSAAELRDGRSLGPLVP